MSSHDETPTGPLEHLRLLQVGWVFLRIGSVAFGGLGAALALIQREFVERRRVLTAADVTEALTYTKLLPGSTVVQVVSYLGFRLHGWTGSALATVATSSRLCLRCSPWRRCTSPQLACRESLQQ